MAKSLLFDIFHEANLVNQIVNLLWIPRKSCWQRGGWIVGAIAVWCHPPMMPPQDKLWMTCEIYCHHRHRHPHLNSHRHRRCHCHCHDNRWGGMQLVRFIVTVIAIVTLIQWGSLSPSCHPHDDVRQMGRDAARHAAWLVLLLLILSNHGTSEQVWCHCSSWWWW